jgi:hypothetical protein
MNKNCYGTSSSLCVVLLQHYRMFKSHMSTHGSCAMVFDIHNQSFLILGRIFSYNFLLDAMTHNTSHLLRFKTIYNNNMVINLKKCPRTCCSIPCEPKILVVLQFHKQFFITCLLFNL